MSDEMVLAIEGLVEQPLRLSFDDLDALPGPAPCSMSRASIRRGRGMA